MTRSWALLTLGAVMLAAPLTGASPAAAASPPVGGPTKHDVNLLWKPDAQDIVRGKEIVLDTFDSFGPPFGRDKPVETRTPRSQIGTDERSGKWLVSLTPGKDPGGCWGTFAIERNVIETTATQQTVQYGGTVRLKGCKGVKKFRNVLTGKLADLQGETICTADGCRGGLRISGTLRY